MISLRTLHVDVSSKSYGIKEYKGMLGPIDLGIDLHLNIYRSYEYSVFNERNVIVIGKGPFAGGAFFGAHRLIFIFRSPVSGGLHVSALGGAAYKFMRTGVDAVVIEGKSKEPTITIIRGDEEGKTLVTFDTISYKELESIYNNYEGLRGVRALAKYLLDKYWEFIKRFEARFIAVGPASLKSIYGAIYSPVIDYVNKKIIVEDWAARGGPGTVLLRAHNVVAVIFGGNNEKYIPKILTRFDSINGIVTSLLNKQFVRELIETTSKYSYDLEYKTGGTFGGDYVLYKDRVPYFNWISLMLNDDIRKKIYNYIVKYMLEPFNKEVIERASWYTCGEPCTIRCKKVDSKGRKIDYEPYNGLGPQLGIFDINLIHNIVEAIDSLGYDAIELGNTLAYILNLLSVKLLRPEDINVKGTPSFNPETYRPEDSKINASIALEILERMTLGNNEILRLIAEEGIRKTAKILDEKFKERVQKLGIRFEDVAVYVPYGNYGYITPNYYNSPGVIAPLAILGRYWTLYSLTFMEPEEYASKAIERALNEYLIDNSGWCRFHRRWVEKVLQDLYRVIYNIEVDLKEHAKEYYRKILIYQIKAGAIPRFWESNKVIDLLHRMACEYGSDKWCNKFNVSPQEAAYEWWSRFLKYLLKFLNIDTEVIER